MDAIVAIEQHKCCLWQGRTHGQGVSVRQERLKADIKGKEAGKGEGSKN